MSIGKRRRRGKHTHDTLCEGKIFQYKGKHIYEYHPSNKWCVFLIGKKSDTY